MMKVRLISTCDMSSVGSSVASSWKMDLLLITGITGITVITGIKGFAGNTVITWIAGITNTNTKYEYLGPPQTVCSTVRVSATKQCCCLLSIPGSTLSSLSSSLSSF